MIDSMKNSAGITPQLPSRVMEALDNLLSCCSPADCTDMMLHSLAYINEAQEDEKELLQFLHTLTSVFCELEYVEGNPDTTE
ncbi:MAG: hypothetical protein KA340_08125 [Saprospiraceae bacterium]|nr:hypothetical protein [Saprospiraceae bacterium]